MVSRDRTARYARRRNRRMDAVEHDERAFLARHVAIRIDLAEPFGAADGRFEA